MELSAFVATRNEEGRIVSVAVVRYVMAMTMGYGYANCDSHWIWPCRWYYLDVSAYVVVCATPAPLTTDPVSTRSVHCIALCDSMKILGSTL